MVRCEKIFSLLFLVSAIGCASSSPDQAQSLPNAASYTAFQDRTEGPDLSALKPYGIPKGRCGMILYQSSQTGPVAIFRSTDDGLANMDIEGNVVDLQLVGRGGDTFMNIPSDQYFSGQLQTGVAIEVSAISQWGERFPGGAYIRTGTIEITAADGWSRIVPIAGVAGCRVNLSR